MIEDTPTAAVWTVWLRGLGCGLGLCRLTLAWSLCRSIARGEHEAATEQIEARPTEHLALQHFEAVDVSLDGAGAPGQCQARFDGGIVVAEPAGKALHGLQRTRARPLQPRIEVLRLPLPHELGEVLCQVDGLSDLG